MSTAVRDFTVVRRRKNMVDLLTPKRANVKGYRITAATNFDGVFATLMTADIGSGYLDPNVDATKLNALNNPNHIRIVFDPVTFTLDDDQHLWLKFVPVDFSGAAGTAGPPHLVLPDDETQAAGRVIIAGTAPSGADVNASLQLNLPFGMSDFHIRNNQPAAGTTLFLATALGGPERQVAAQETATMYSGAQSVLFVRGGGGTAAFSADFTHFLPL